MIKEILRKISDRKIKVGIVGLGYVGLPLAGEFVKAGFTTIGFDIDPEKVKLLGKSQSYIKHIPSENIKS
ncbi:MAG TPA: NAD(P)-binding domain-containing protein, partial [Victivallales bacterium]|nr:NAD(P)-binding domain-containing protein [Victivallales bacterium]